MMKDTGQDTGSTYDVPTPKKFYPSLSLSLEKFPELNEVGKEITLTVKGCVRGVRETDDGGSVEVEIYECGVGDDSKEEANEADKELGRLKGGK